MPRAHRHFIPGQLWHATHRCHEEAFLLKFARDRHRYLRSLFEAKKRFGLCVLNYVVTSKHVHLLLKDTGAGAIASSLQLVASRTAQEYNVRRGRCGAFCFDRELERLFGFGKMSTNRMSTPSTVVVLNFSLRADGTYEASNTKGHYAFDPATRAIIWLDGPHQKAITKTQIGSRENGAAKIGFVLNKRYYGCFMPKPRPK